MLVHVNTDQCEYRFEWRTSVVCKSSEAKLDAGCNYVDKEANFSFDLSHLTSNGNDIQVRCHRCFTSV